MASNATNSSGQGNAVRQWFDSADELDDIAHVKASRGAGPSRHGAITLTASQRQALGAEVSDGPLQSVAKDHRKMAALPSAKKFSSYIDRWNTQHKPDVDPASPGDVNSDSGATHSVQDKDSQDHEAGEGEGSAVSASPDGHFDYTDEGKKACLLCQRQFKAVEVLRRHVVESDLHKKNLADDAACEAGRKRKGPAAAAPLPANMKRAGFAPVTKEAPDGKDASNTEPQYRDRASERRAVFGVEKQAKPWQGPKKLPPIVLKDVKATAPLTQAKPKEPTPPPALDESSVGGSLLAKMGWSSGKGLGATGQGRVDPVQASIYAQGAGLGSTRSQPETVEEHAEAAKKRARVEDASYSEYLKDRTRMRFAKAGESSS